MSTTHPFPRDDAETSSYAQEVFAAVDRMDAAGFAGYFAEHGRFVFGNAEPCVGPAAVRAAVASFFSAIAGLRHEVHAAWHCGDAVVCEVTATYTRHDGSRIALPAATVWRGGDSGIEDYRIYADLTPLFQAAR